MVLFLIKKTFFDFWDNMIPIVLLNIGFLLIIVGESYLFSFLFEQQSSFFSGAPQVFLLFLFVFSLVGSVVFFIYAGAAAKIVKEIADFQTPKLQDFFTHLKNTYKASSIFALIFVSYFLFFFVSGRFYLSTTIIIGGFNVGIIVFTVLFLCSFFIALASQYYLPLQTNFDSTVKKNIRKMFILLYDNTGFTILLFLLNMFILVLSVLTFFILIGPTVNLLLCMVALKLRFYKYDYYEKYPDFKSRRIPWDELLAKDREMVGKRTLKEMIFPWKK